jgi:hypothetical protein
MSESPSELIFSKNEEVSEKKGGGFLLQVTSSFLYYGQSWCSEIIGKGCKARGRIRVVHFLI